MSANQPSRSVQDAVISAHRVTTAIADGPETSVRVWVGPARDALVDLEREWDALFGEGSHEPSVSHEWTAALITHHVPANDPVVVLRIRRGEQTTALVPLVFDREVVLGYRVRTLSVASDLYNTHSDLLARDLDLETTRAFFTALANLREKWDVFRLRNVLDDHPIVNAVSMLTREWPLALYARSADPSYVLDLPQTFAEYLALRSQKFRNHWRRTEKKLEADPSLRVSVVTEPAHLDAAYDRLIEIERASWKHEHGTAISAAPAQEPFFRDLCRGAAARGRLHLQFLWLGEQPVAYNLGYLRHREYAYLKTSYRHDFRAHGVATYLRARLVRELIEQGIVRMDFPGAMYEWEHQWTTTVRGHQAISFYAATPVGRALAVAARAKHLWRDKTPHHRDPRAYRIPAGE